MAKVYIISQGRPSASGFDEDEEVGARSATGTQSGNENMLELGLRPRAYCPLDCPVVLVLVEFELS